MSMARFANVTAALRWRISLRWVGKPYILRQMNSCRKHAFRNHVITDDVISMLTQWISFSSANVTAALRWRIFPRWQVGAWCFQTDDYRAEVEAQRPQGEPAQSCFSLLVSL